MCEGEYGRRKGSGMNIDPARVGFVVPEEWPPEYIPTWHFEDGDTLITLDQLDDKVWELIVSLPNGFVIIADVTAAFHAGGYSPRPKLRLV